MLAREFYLPDDDFDLEWPAGELQAEIERAEAEGYAALRVTAEMSWAAQAHLSTEQLLEYGAALNGLLCGQRCLALCQFDRRRFSADVALVSLLTHPLVIVGTELHHNIYYTPPEELVGESRVEAILQHWLRTLVERKRGEEALRESERRFREMANLLPDIVYEADTDFRLTYGNRTAFETLGYAPEDLAAGLAIADVVSEEAVARAQAQLEHVARTEEPSIGVYELKRKDGSTVLCEVHSVAVRSRGGELLGYRGVARDTGERQQVEDFLRKLETAVTQSIDGICVSGRDGVLEFANPAWARMHGYDSDESLVGKNVRDFHTPEQIERDMLPFNEEMKRKGSHRAEVGHMRRGGTTFPTWMTGTYLRDEQGELVGYVGIARDITKRRQAEEALRRSEQRYRMLFETSPDGIAITDLEGHLVDANQAFQNMVGRELDELRGMTYQQLTPEEWQELEAERVVARTRAGGYEVFEKEYLRKDGTRFPVSLTGWAITDKHGQPEGLGAFVRDITERKQAEEERERLEAQIQHAQKLRSLGVLAGGIAHDFNNILVGVLGNASLALMQLPPGTPAHSCIERIETAALRASELSRQMLAYSGKGQFVIEPLHLSRLVEEMSDLLRSSLSKRAELRRQLQRDLPLVEGDATQLRQVVLNLIMNASEALGPDGGAITVQTGVQHATRAHLGETYVNDDLPEGRYVYLEVSDTGQGMDEETSARIFDPFFSTKSAGRGLGLGVVLGIVRGHRGAIAVDSTPGEGTSFRVLLPCAEHAQERARHPPAALLQPETIDRRAGAILVADDEPGVRDVAQAALEMAGFTVVTAADGQEAVERFAQRADEIIAVLLDMTMPKMSGREAFDQIHHLRPNVPVVLSSGFNEQDATSGFVGRGLAGFIQKPYRLSELVEKMEQVLAQSIGERQTS
jgi:PAS domain S-box-containing protein